MKTKNLVFFKAYSLVKLSLLVNGVVRLGEWMKKIGIKGCVLALQYRFYTYPWLQIFIIFFENLTFLSNSDMFAAQWKVA